MAYNLRLYTLFRPFYAIFTFVVNQVRAYRARAYIEATLDWDGSPIVSLSRPNPLWRAVVIRATASRTEELVLAGGELHARLVEAKGWMSLGDLEDYLRLPLTIPANRRQEFRISGKSIARALRGTVGSGPVLLRIVIHDYQYRRLMAEPLCVTCEILEEEWSR